MMAAGVVTVPLAELACEDGTPRSRLMNQASQGFDDAAARDAGNPACNAVPAGCAPAPRADRRGGPRRADGDARSGRLRLAPPGTDPESGEVTAIIERLRAGESPLAIARETGADGGPGLRRRPGSA